MRIVATRLVGAEALRPSAMASLSKANDDEQSASPSHPSTTNFEATGMKRPQLMACQRVVSGASSMFQQPLIRALLFEGWLPWP